MHSTRSNFDKVWVWNERLCLLHSPLLDKMKCTWIFGGISLDLSPNGTYVPRNITIASPTMITSIVQCTILCSFACLIPFGSLKIRSYVVNPVVISLFSSSASLSHTASLARSNCDCYQDRLFFVHYFRLPCVRVCVHIQLKCLCGQCTPASQPISSYRSHSDACWLLCEHKTYLVTV